MMRIRLGSEGCAKRYVCSRLLKLGRSHVQVTVEEFENSTINSDFKQNNMVYSVKHEEIFYTERQGNIYIMRLLHYVAQKED